mmetsp:Transcript_37247/g.78550  ORF Transcript_37247/g.78550 Transcript_37247/m.78550 type:complete len:298 (-) Transcript_37247:212-1105(-)
MVRRTSDNVSQKNNVDDKGDASSPQPQDRIKEATVQEEGGSTSQRVEQDDIETGFVGGINRLEQREEGKKEEEKQDAPVGGIFAADGADYNDSNSEYTHISIPLPGCNADCIDKLNKETSSDTEDLKQKQQHQPPGKKPIIRTLFGYKGGNKEGTNASTSTSNNTILESKEDPTKTDIKDTNNNGGDDKAQNTRDCTIFCAICLMEYEISDRISWSSNAACTHVFHEDCIVQWLVSLGRTKSKQQRFSEDPDEAQLLNYTLECPCCRQEFIARKVADLPEVCDDRGGGGGGLGDENV